MTAATLFHAIPADVPTSVTERLASGLLAVEDELGRQQGSSVPTVEAVGRLTLEAGGKRLRPALALLAAGATRNDFSVDRIVRLGACLEMIHMATLIHDDVIDQAATRRGHPTASHVHGNTVAILSGDVLLAKAMRILAEDGDLRVIRTVSSAVVELAEGEVRELAVRGEFDLKVDEHFEILRMKTAAFIECCCRVGAMAAGATSSAEDALGAYGHHIGMAFQVADDLLDFRGERAKTGKPTATDFREGQATLPLLFLASELTAAEAEFAREKFGNGVTDDEVLQIAKWMDDRGAFRRASDVADRHVDQAKASLVGLPETPERALLSTVADFVARRDA